MQEWYLGWEKVSYLERCPYIVQECPHRESGSTAQSIMCQI